MRDIFTEIFENQPLDPSESARRGARPKLRKLFYSQAHVGEAEGGGFPLLLDGKPVKTPARRALTFSCNSRNRVSYDGRSVDVIHSIGI